MTATYYATAGGLAAALAALGTTAEGVAEALRAGGWRGAPECPDICPIARYLGAAIPGDFVFGFDVGYVSTWIVVHGVDGGRFRVDTPEPVRAFTHAFDRGAHPDLSTRRQVTA